MPKPKNVQSESNKSANIEQVEPITPEKPKKMSKMDMAMVTAIKAEPGMTKAQLANRVVSLGAAKHIQSVYGRLKKRDYLNAELSQIEDFHAQQLQREDYPLARKRLNKALKDNDITHKEALPYVKLVYDKVHGEKHFNQAPQVIHIDAINNAQFLIKDDVA